MSTIIRGGRRYLRSFIQLSIINNRARPLSSGKRRELCTEANSYRLVYMIMKLYTMIIDTVYHLLLYRYYTVFCNQVNCLLHFAVTKMEFSIYERFPYDLFHF